MVGTKMVETMPEYRDLSEAGYSQPEWEQYEWRDEPPTTTGDFFYDGPLPDGSGNVVAIVQVTHNPKTQGKEACLFIPPYWRGCDNQHATFHFGEIEKWQGRWAGPEHGLCCATAG